jgi:hypothetical protein
MASKFTIESKRTGKRMDVWADSPEDAVQIAIAKANENENQLPYTMEDVEYIPKKTYNEPSDKAIRAVGETVAREGVPALAVRGLFPASVSVAEEDGGPVKQVLAGVADAAANLAGLPAKAAGVLGRLGAFAMRHPAMADIGMQTGIGATQGVLSGQGAVASGALSGGIAGGVQGTAGAARLLKEMGPQGYAKFASELTGSDPEALLAWSKGKPQQKAIREAAETTGEIGQKILDDLNNVNLTNADRPEVIEALNGKTVDLGNTIQAMRDRLNEVAPGSKGRGLSDQEKIVHDKINSVLKYLEGEKPKAKKKPSASQSYLSGRRMEESIEPNTSGYSTVVDANEGRRLRGAYLDQMIDFSAEGLDRSTAGMLNEVLKAGRTQLKDDLIEAGGPQYKDAMARWSQKLQAREKLARLFGRDQFTQEQRVEKTLDNIFNRNKSKQQEVLKAYDDAFGREYSEQLRNAFFAKSLGVTEFQPKPSWVPTQYTGRSNLGLGIMASGGSGMASLGMPAVAPGLIPLTASAWSPRAATFTLSMMQAAGAGKPIGGKLAQTIQAVNPVLQNLFRSQAQQGKK